MSFPQLELQLPTAFLTDFLETAQHAQQRIWVQSMNYDPTPETQLFEKILIEKAHQKLDVRMNIDWISERFYDHSFNYVPNIHIPNFTDRKKIEH